MKILLTNDDGVYAPGLAAMERALGRLGEVCLVAPLVEQSGAAHSITYLSPLICQEVFDGDRHRGWAVEGSPADCVKIGIFEFCGGRPDLVVSGINGGLNAGINVLYSGTVAAAIEGAFFGIPSVAVSLEYAEHAEFDRAAALACRIIEQILEKAGVGGQGSEVRGQDSGVSEAFSGQQSAFSQTPDHPGHQTPRSPAHQEQMSNVAWRMANVEGSSAHQGHQTTRRPDQQMSNVECRMSNVEGHSDQTTRPPDTKPRLFNLNIPTAAVADGRREPPQVRVVPMDVARWGERFEKRIDPRGRSYFWATGGPPVPGGSDETDLAALMAGHVTLTPLDFQMTRFDELERMRGWQLTVDRPR